MKLIKSLFKVELIRSIQYKEKIIINLLMMSFIILIEYSIFAAYADAVSKKNLLIYIILSNTIFQSLLVNRLPKFCVMIKKGEVAKYFLYPYEILNVVIAEDFAESIIKLFEVGIFLVVAIAISNSTILNGGAFIISLLMSILLAVLTAENLYSISFALHNYAAAKALLAGISGIFSGALIPLSLMPEWFVEICYYTPFSLLIDAPINILTSGNVQLIYFQFFWCLVLMVSGKALFKLFINKNVIYGG